MSDRPHHTPATRILVVDDHEPVRRATQRMLERGGYEVVTAGSAVEAVELCRNGGEFDLLLTDLVMPDLDGESLAQRLRTLQRGLVVLFMSGYAQGPDFAYEDGATLGKPFTAEALLRSVHETLASARHRAPGRPA